MLNASKVKAILGCLLDKNEYDPRDWVWLGVNWVEGNSETPYLQRFFYQSSTKKEKKLGQAKKKNKKKCWTSKNNRCENVGLS